MIFGHSKTTHLDQTTASPLCRDSSVIGPYFHAVASMKFPWNLVEEVKYFLEVQILGWGKFAVLPCFFQLKKQQIRPKFVFPIFQCKYKKGNFQQKYHPKRYFQNLRGRERKSRGGDICPLASLLLHNWRHRFYGEKLTRIILW